MLKPYSILHVSCTFDLKKPVPPPSPQNGKSSDSTCGGFGCCAHPDPAVAFKAPFPKPWFISWVVCSSHLRTGNKYCWHGVYLWKGNSVVCVLYSINFSMLDGNSRTKIPLSLFYFHQSRLSLWGWQVELMQDDWLNKETSAVGCTALDLMGI